MTARIVVDAMGGDNAPQEIVAGALMAAGGLGVELILVGRWRRYGASSWGRRRSGLRIVEAPDIIEMDEHATDAVRAKPHASINVGLRW
jgi:glycerol-3-phosphate acyltransferase PlsX